MPQLDPTWFVSQLFWLCVCFFTMLFIMGKIIAPRIADILAQRQRKIDDYLVKAHQIKEQAEESLQKYHEALAKATAEADEALAQTHRELAEYISKKQEDLAKKLSAKISEGEAQINAQKEQALKEVYGIAEVLAVDVVKKMGLKQISSQNLKDSLKKIAND